MLFSVYLTYDASVSMFFKMYIPFEDLCIYMDKMLYVS